MQKKFPRFIIVDTDTVGNILSKATIKASIGEVEVTSFEVHAEAMHYIKNECLPGYRNGYVIVFVGLDEPHDARSKFLTSYAHLDKKVRNYVRLIVLSGSQDVRMKEKALKNRNVSQFIHKPLTSAFVKQMFS